MKEKIETQEQRQNNIDNALSNIHFHSEHKGCEMTFDYINTNIGGTLINCYCHTHNVRCSKTGWELGWYAGTFNKDVYKPRSHKFSTCSCGRKYFDKGNGMCRFCYIEKHPDKVEEYKAERYKHKRFMAKRRWLLNSGLSEEDADKGAGLYIQKMYKERLDDILN